MIIMKIWGGLGNQMFQYATGKALSARLQQPLKLDTGFYAMDTEATKRELQLDVFNDAYSVATTSEIKRVLGLISFKVVKKFFRKYSNRYLEDPSFVYNPKVDKIRSNAYLEGYWQSYKYFAAYRDMILRTFTFPEQIKSRVNGIAGTMQGQVTASVHIRRGDYVTNQATNAFHGTCDLNYYNSAIAYLRERYPDLYILVFSDDIPWVKENLQVPGKHLFVENINGHPAEDMYLMSRCNHNIIANSSFSWWGAWLNDHKDRIVIAPQKWFNADMPTHDLIPKEWIRL